MVKLKPSPSTLSDITGLLAVAGIFKQSVSAGTPIGVQFKAFSQSAFTEPFHVFPMIKSACVLIFGEVEQAAQKL
jgi:hypothetical protein